MKDAISGIARFAACGCRKSLIKIIELNLARIENSRGIRLPADLIRKHGLEPGMVLEDRGHELVLRKRSPKHHLKPLAAA